MRGRAYWLVVCTSLSLAIAVNTWASPDRTGSRASQVRQASEFADANGRLDLARVRRSHYEGTLDLSGSQITLDPATGAPLVKRPAAGPGHSESITAGWLPTFSPADMGVSTSEQVAAFTTYQGHLIVGGGLHLGAQPNATTSIANNVAEWDGSGWKALAGGLSGNVSALAVFGTELIAAGSFTGGGQTYIAKWDGSSWSNLGSSSFNGPINALAVIGTTLYAGGTFTTYGSTTMRHVAAWNGSAWTEPGGGLNGTVRALAVKSGDLFAGGDFSGHAASSASGTGTWSILGQGLNNQVNAMTVWSNTLTIGGAFTEGIDDDGTHVSMNRVASWSGSWGAIGSLGSTGQQVKSLGMDPSGHLVAGGDFTGRVSIYDGSAWSVPGNGVTGDVLGIIAYGGKLICGGSFDGAVSPTAQLARIGQWDGSSWTNFGYGVTNTYHAGYQNDVQGTVLALCPSSSNLLVGGQFIDAGGVSALRIASWGGAAWSALGGGIQTGAYPGWTPAVRAIAIWNGNVVVGGTFLNAAGTTASRIALWNGATWVALGSGLNEGLNNDVNALAVVGSDLYVGGSFTATNGGGTTLSRVAKWNGSAWSAVGSGSNQGLSSTVRALLADGSDLIVGGDFTATSGNGTSLLRLAKWSGSAWSAVGGGTDGVVRALAKLGSWLYVGGDFTHVNGSATAAAHVARFYSGSWDAMNGGVTAGSGSPTVSALCAYHDCIVAGGVFTSAGSGGAALTVSNIARWRWASADHGCLSGWTRVGTATDIGASGDAVYALAVVEDNLFVGGSIRTADGYIVNQLAVYAEDPTDAVAPSQTTTLSAFRGTHTVGLSWIEVGDDTTSGVAQGFEFRRSYSAITNANWYNAFEVFPSYSVLGAGNSNCVAVDQLDACTTYYFAMRTYDDNCNYSDVSNNVSFTTRCSGSIEVACGGTRAVPSDEENGALWLAAPRPSPASGSFTLQFNIPTSMSGQELDVALFDLAGRRLASLSRGRSEPGMRTLVVPLSTVGSGLRPGAYFIGVKVGTERVTQRILIVR